MTTNGHSAGCCTIFPNYPGGAYAYVLVGSRAMLEIDASRTACTMLPFLCQDMFAGECSHRSGSCVTFIGYEDYFV